MSYMKIHCGRCGGTWEIYGRDDWNSEKARQCPHCFSEIDRQTWFNQVVPGFCAVADANRELYKDHTGYHGQELFRVDVISDKVSN